MRWVEMIANGPLSSPCQVDSATWLLPRQILLSQSLVSTAGN